MKQALKSIGLLLLLLTAQQGAVVHELSHLASLDKSAVEAASGAMDTACALCPAFAQAASPAFGHSFHLPSLVRAALVRCADPLHAAIDAATPRPRSRGPPSQA